MPSVDVAMARSLRGGIWGSITGSLSANMQARDLGSIQEEAGKAVDAFSSWDNCMEVTYCKWPVIAVIIVGGLILLSVVWCLARCLCCGLSCCCECCYCLKCCGNCCGCCDPPKGKPHKYLDDETHPTHGYRSEPPMKAPMFSPVGADTHAHEPPQYAQFEVTRKGGEDSLPSMPTWETAGSQKVLVEEEAVEMNKLNTPSNGQSVASASAAAAASAAAVAAAAGHNGYRQPSPAGGNAYGAPAQHAGHYAADYPGQGYGQAASPYAADQYGAAAAMATGPRRTSPHQDYNGGYNQQQGYATGHSTGPYGDEYNQGYAMDRRGPSPAAAMPYAQEPAARHSPAPQADYGYAQQQQYGAGEQQYPPASGAGYRQSHSEQTVGISNTGGFDFNSGYARPQQYEGFRQPSPAQHQPPASNGGYQAYSPHQQHPPQGGWN